MRSFFITAIALTLRSSASNITLEQVYGAVEKVESMTPLSKSSLSRAVKPQSFYSTRTPENCEFPFEILIVQDVTASFDDNFPMMRDFELPKMVDVLSNTHPNSTFGLVSFRDKPVEPFGTPETDYCQKIELDFTSTVTDLTTAYDGFTRIGGGDPSENQFGALIASAKSTKLSWGASLESTKLVVLVTDAPPHFEADGYDKQGMKPNQGVFNDDSADTDCTEFYYPSPDQVSGALKGLEAYFAVLVYDPEYWNGLPASSWQWFNRFLGQTDDFANLIANDQSNFWEKLSSIITFVEDLECTNTESTTVSPTVSPVGSTQQPPAPTEECEESTICEEGLVIKMGFRPDNLKVVLNGKHLA